MWRGGPATSAGGTYTALSNNFDTGVGGSGGTCTGGEVRLVRSLAAGGPKDGSGFSKVIYAGTDGFGGATTPAGGRVFVTTNAGGALMADRTGTINPGQFPVSAIAIDTSDATGQTAYAAVMGFHVGHVFKTTNAGVSWAAFSTNLPDAPADALVVDSQTGTVYVGTDVGVFSSPTATANWAEVGPAAAAGNSGFLPNVPVTALRLFNSGGKKLLRASTYGRGIWQYDLLGSTTPDYSITITNSTQTVFAGQNATFNGKLTAANGYASAVALSCAAGTTAAPGTCSASPASVTPTGAGAAFTVTSGGTAQDYLFNVHAVGTDASTTTHDAAVTLHVVDFALGAASPASVSVQQGNTSQGIAFVVSGAGAFSGTVTLACPASGMPAGVTCGFSPSAVVSALPATVTLTFSTTVSTPLGTTPITISATTPGAPAAKTQSVSVTVTAPAADYTLAISNSNTIGDSEPVGNFQWNVEGRKRIREPGESDLRHGRAADLHGGADIGDADRGRGIFHSHGEEYAGPDLQLYRQWRGHGWCPRGAHSASGFQFPVHADGCKQHRAAEPEGWTERCLQSGRHARGCDDVPECR